MISVIIPIYNVEKYLRQCLDSVVNQTYKNIEIILVDDGSTDGSYSIAKEYADKDARIKLFKQENSGQGAARNFGIKEAKGEYITFVDSDDYIDVNMLSTMISYMADNDIVCCKEYIVGKHSGEHDDFFSNNLNKSIIINENNITNIPSVVWGKLYKLNILKDNKIFFPEGLFYEDDYFFWCYSIYNPKAYFTDHRLYYYRRRDNGSIIAITQSKKSKKIFDIIQIASLIYALLNNQKIFDKWKEAYLQYLQTSLIWRVQYLKKEWLYEYYENVYKLLYCINISDLKSYKFLYYIKYLKTFQNKDIYKNIYSIVIGYKSVKYRFFNFTFMKLILKNNSLFYIVLGLIKIKAGKNYE
jgi:glycosyltransferase involved in cell wall biosynthesis